MSAVSQCVNLSPCLRLLGLFQYCGYTHTHMHTHTHTHTHARTHTTHAHKHMHTHTRTHTNTRTRTHAHSHTHTAMPKEVSKARIACLDFSLQKAKMALGVQVLVTDPEKLDAIQQRCTPTSLSLSLSVSSLSLSHSLVLC